MVINMKIEEKIENILDKLRPFLINDGGNIEFLRYEKGIVYVRFLGACSNCRMLDVTLSEGIEAALTNEIPEVIKVVNEP